MHVLPGRWGGVWSRALDHQINTWRGMGQSRARAAGGRGQLPRPEAFEAESLNVEISPAASARMSSPFRDPTGSPSACSLFYTKISSHFQVRRRKPQTQRAFGRCSPQPGAELFQRAPEGLACGQVLCLLLFHTFFGSWG